MSRLTWSIITAFLVIFASAPPAIAQTNAAMMSAAKTNVQTAMNNAVANYCKTATQAQCGYFRTKALNCPQLSLHAFPIFRDVATYKKQGLTSNQAVDRTVQRYQSGAGSNLTGQEVANIATAAAYVQDHNPNTNTPQGEAAFMQAVNQQCLDSIPR